MTNQRHRFKCYEDDGWTVTLQPGGHMRLTHPQVRGFTMCSGTPSDYRSDRNLKAKLRKALREGVMPGFRVRV